VRGKATFRGVLVLEGSYSVDALAAQLDDCNPSGRHERHAEPF
jgi:hypothetical protein